MENFLIAPAALAANVLCQLLLCRVTGLLKSVYAGFAAGLCAVLIMQWAVSPAETLLWDAAANVVIYGALGYCYFHFVNLGETARRIRIMRELAAAPQGLTREEILSRYNAAEIVKIRLGRLVRNAQAISENGRLRLAGNSVLFMAHALTGLKLLLLGRRTCDGGGC